ncbi:hypothetical protein TIFTF001_023043 [Ficus carica]|uniref:Uncharacterized protein n=1 Tax=Ficus carica TaxID=3494 RepID=A0AA88AWH0_FICCA|nr:hypothetical protein TIFTF001_023043 [Ficus carica]
MDQTERDIELLLCNLKPHVVFFDFAYWMPKLARHLGIKTVYLSVVNLVMKAYIAGKNYEGQETSMPDIKLVDRLFISQTECDANVSKGSREIEGPFTELVERFFGKSIILAGPVIPETPISSFSLEEKWVKYLDRLPFLAALKPPLGAETIEEALPDGFVDRIGSRAVVH